MVDKNFEEFGRDRWPNFETSTDTGKTSTETRKFSTVTGMNLLDLVDWVRTSNCVLKKSENPNGMPVIAMPPVQRSAVWRPKQVLDFWDSLMRGLPIGTFYLVKQAEKRKVTMADGDGTGGKTIETPFPGFDLLDGQQRVRALWVGTHGCAEEERCLWVDLGEEAAKDFPRLYLTSKAQPFGYDPQTGRKLPLDDRRKAREAIEPDPKSHPIMFDAGTSEERFAYDLDLFMGSSVTQDGKPIEHPPRPYRATKGKTFKLQNLLAAWRKRSPRDTDGGIKALRQVMAYGIDPDAPVAIDPAALQVLDNAFRKVEEAQVALLCVNPENFHDSSKDLLALFGRIGAGGTALTNEEQLFSIYKYYVPELRDAVERIYDTAGRILPPTKIAATALRIANARTHDEPGNGNWLPGVDVFAKEMAKQKKSDLWFQLEQLIPRTSVPDGPREPGPLSRSFEMVKGLLSYDKDAGNFWMPDVLLTELPAELWQVLVFWAAKCPDPTNLEFCRKEAVRFALFWHLCVSNNDKAANWAFEYIKDNKITSRADFPGAALYLRLIEAGDDESCATPLMQPCEFKRLLCKKVDPSWQTDVERFGEGNKRNVIGSHWWWYGKKILPWLQRDYIRDKFPGYAPLTNNEDDLPYDVDHICPWSDWGEDWRRVTQRIDVGNPARQKMRDNRNAVGNGIGNLRLIASWENRHDQDVAITVKMPFVEGRAEPTPDELRAMKASAFPPDDRALWRLAAGKDKRWNTGRLAAFQQAAEQRAAWLYECFHDDLGYEAWTS
ncbi:DUF262 domain-containing protein [Methylocapsa acidiphila]|uniref:DUF262 domain-containing protein n=1 Tax=Methylocapsa acidiphila TaxID=133552 RepID=UPI00040EBFF3|nr:DUF262 domain-containing protein [Methylocapsa acidiphila]